MRRERNPTERIHELIHRCRVKRTIAETCKSITLSRFLFLFCGGAGGEVVFLRGHLEEIRVQPDTAAPWNMTQGWMEAFRPVSVFPHVVLLFFICPSPNKTRTALSDTHTLTKQTRLCHSHSLSLPLFKKTSLYRHFSCKMVFFSMRESKATEKQDVTGDVINFKSAVRADYTSLRENVICKVSKCLFFLL